MSEESTFYEVALEDVPELTVVDEGEHKVQITDAEFGTSEKTGGKYLLLRLEVPTVPNSKDFTDVMMLPTQEDSEKQRIKRLNRIKDMCEAVGYDFSARGGVDTDALQGLEGWAHLAVEQDSQYGEQNRVRKWVKGQ